MAKPTPSNLSFRRIQEYELKLKRHLWDFMQKKKYRDLDQKRARRLHVLLNVECLKDERFEPVYKFYQIYYKENYGGKEL